MIGFYNYTVILTYLGTICGFVGITYMANGNLKMALIFLMIAGFCDLFDGKIASTMKRTKSEKRFGIQIDSLSDLICFGVLPAFIVSQCSDVPVVRVLVPALYMLCALIRLAWFNVDEEERQDREEGGRELYLGLPVTTSALFVPMFISAIKLLKLPMNYVAPAILLVIAIAFITPFHVKKPGWAGKIAMVIFGIAGLVLVIAGVRV
jgi:CDP-diacylglycerol--serine O-phosphatidyltransferase